jgi:PAS domain S-box-containing protein
MSDAHPSIQEILPHLDFLREFFDQQDFGMMLVDGNHRIHWASQVLRKMNFCHQELDGLDNHCAVTIEGDRCINCPIKAMCENPGKHVFFSTQHNSDNPLEPEHTYSIITHSIPNHAQAPGYHLIVVHDITERKLAFREKQELRLILSNVLENTVDAVITLDHKGDIHSWNRGAWQVFGYTKEEITGRHIGILIPDDMESQQDFEEMLRILDDQGFVRNQRASMMTKGKGIIHVAITQTTMRNSSGEPIGYSLIIRDISKVVHLEKSLSQKVNQLEKLLQLDDSIRSAKDLPEIFTAILVAITAGEGLRFNRAYLLLVDYDSNELVGMQAVGPGSGEEAHRIYSQHEANRDLTLSEIIEQRQQLGDTVDVAVNAQVQRIVIPLTDTENPIIRCLDDNRPYLYLRGGSDDDKLARVPVLIDSDQFVAVPLIWQNRKLGVILADNFINRADISMDDVQFLSTFANRTASAISNIQLRDDLRVKIEELKNAYQRMSESQDAILRQERLAALGEMASKVAHEIRNPLSSIGGFANLVYRQSVNDQDRKYLKIIADETQRLERILQDVLGYVRSPRLEETPSDLNKLIEESRLLAEKQMQEPNISFVMELGRIPAIPVMAHQVKQVLLNIIQNGLEAMGRNGRMTIRTSVQGPNVVVSIADTGVGISPENLEKLFTPFFTTKSRGLGLGLNVSRQLIEQHGGVIEVESAENTGTTFTIKLPLAGKEASHDDFEQEKVTHR